MISALTNTSALLAQFGLKRNQDEQNTVLERLATGKKLNSGKDNPAALIISEQLSAELAALQAEADNIQRADANATIVDGHVSQLSTLMTDLNSLVVSSANSGAMSEDEIAANQMQIDSIRSSIQRITGDARSSLENVSLPDDGNTEIDDALTAASVAAASVASGGANDLTSGNFEAAQDAVRSAALEVSKARGKIGAYQKYNLQPRLNANRVAYENLAESRSRIRDTDYAVETSNLARSQILTAASVHILKIAQQQTASVLHLLG